jgi:hypothetical protein
MKTVIRIGMMNNDEVDIVTSQNSVLNMKAITLMWKNCMGDCLVDNQMLVAIVWTVKNHYTSNCLLLVVLYYYAKNDSNLLHCIVDCCNHYNMYFWRENLGGKQGTTILYLSVRKIYFPICSRLLSAFIACRYAASLRRLQPLTMHTRTLPLPTRLPHLCLL